MQSYQPNPVADEIRSALKGNRSSVLKLFQGRQVQPTDHVIKCAAPFALRSPIDPVEVSLLESILDPNKTGFVTLKRVRELVAATEDDLRSLAMVPHQQQQLHSHQTRQRHRSSGSSNTSVSSYPQHQQKAAPPSGGSGSWQAPKRPPPTPRGVQDANHRERGYQSTALALHHEQQLSVIQQSSNDPDMVAIMMALNWSGKHMSNHPSPTERRLASTPLSRYSVPIPAEIVPMRRGEVELSMLGNSLRHSYSDDQRGWAAAGMLAALVRSEVVFRETVRQEIPPEIVPEDILAAFLETPRRFRHSILESSKTPYPHQILSTLSPVRLPLAVTALRVEMDSTARKVSNAFLPQEIAQCWLRASEKDRCAFVTSLYELEVWDDDFMAHLEGEDLRDIVLCERVLSLEDSKVVDEETELRDEVDRLQKLIQGIASKAAEPFRANLQLENSNQLEDGAPRGERHIFGKDLQDPSAEDVAITELQTRIHSLCADLWL